MKSKTCILFTLSGLLLASSLAGQNVKAITYARNGRIITVPPETNIAYTTEESDVCEIAEKTDTTATMAQDNSNKVSETANSAYAVMQENVCETTETVNSAIAIEQDDATQTTEISSAAAQGTEDGSDSASDRAAFQKKCRIYEPFGLTYDADKNELWYNKKLVRWFEDSYPVGDGGEAGIDFFNEKGVVDVYALRDLKNLPRNADGSYDPSGRLTGLKEFSQEEFDARDIDAIKNPVPREATAVEGSEPLSVREMKEIAAEYKAFGVTYNAATDQWYYRGQKVRFFLDVLTSNGEDFNSGEFHGSVRMHNSDEGTVDIYTVRDFHTPNADGNGTLTAVKAYSQQEFDARTQEDPILQEMPW